MLHLVMPAPVRPLAAESLRAMGYAPQLNGVGILVPVSNDHKAAPFRILAEARIPIDDFEIVPVNQTPRAASPGDPAPPLQGEAR